MPRRGENIFKRKDGRWEARYVKEIALDGKKEYGSVYAKTYREVKANQQLYINKPLGSARKSTATLDEIMHEWLEQSKNQLKISSYQKYQTIVRNHISKQLGKLPIKNLTSTAIVQFTDNLLLNDGLSKDTANNVLIVLGMGLEFAKTHYQVTIPDIHFLRTTKAKTRVLSVHEQKVLVQYLLSQDNIFSFGMLLALYTGLRVGELCALKWEDFFENTIHISKTMQRLKNTSGQTEVMILPPKTSSSDMVIPIPRAILPFIDKYRRDSGYILTRPNGSYIEPRLMQYNFSQYVKKCGLEDVHFHTLRHTFATRCIESGIGEWAFYGCEGLTSLNIPDSVTEIGSNAFTGFTVLTSVTINGGIKKISRAAFSGCTGLTFVTIPDSVTKISGWAFYWCTSLTSITIPDSVTEIGEWAFYGCPNLTIRCSQGSYVEQYAKENDIPYQLI